MFYTTLLNAGRRNLKRFVTLLEDLLRQWYTSREDHEFSSDVRFYQYFVNGIRMLGEWENQSSLSLLENILGYPGVSNFAHTVHREALRRIRRINTDAWSPSEQLKPCWCLRKEIEKE